MLAKGLGYLDLPAVIGLIRSQIQAAKAEPILPELPSLVSLSLFQVSVMLTLLLLLKISLVLVLELLLSVNIDENGAVTNLGIISGGENYVEPVVFFVENSGEYIAKTKTIGRVRSVQVVDIGSIHHADT